MEDCKVVKMSLTDYEINLRKRLFFNLSEIYTVDIIDIGVARISIYKVLNTVKFYTNGKTFSEIANEILKI